MEQRETGILIEPDETGCGQQHYATKSYAIGQRLFLIVTISPDNGGLGTMKEPSMPCGMVPHSRVLTHLKLQIADKLPMEFHRNKTGIADTGKYAGYLCLALGIFPCWNFDFGWFWGMDFGVVSYFASWIARLEVAKKGKRWGLPDDKPFLSCTCRVWGKETCKELSKLNTIQQKF